MPNYFDKTITVVPLSTNIPGGLNSVIFIGVKDPDGLISPVTMQHKLDLSNLLFSV